jgi:Tfp pilus assembly protein PilV
MWYNFYMKRLRRKGLGFNGLTLVEVMVSIGILLAGVVGALGAVVSLTVLTNASALLSTAAAEAQYEMEQIRALPFGSVVSYVETGTRLPGESKAVVVSTIGVNLKQVTVTVSWTESGASRNYVLTTLIAQ